MKRFWIASIIFLLWGCSTNSSLKSAMGECDSTIKSNFAAGDVVRFTYRIDKQDEVAVLANSWCGERGKAAKKSSVNCDGCCSATYRCFKQ